MDKLLKNEKIKKVILFIMACLAALSLVQGCRNAMEASQDFQWDAAKAFTLKINPYDESLNPGRIPKEYEFEKYYLQMEANQFPSLLILLIPFTFLPPLTARYIWLLCNLLFTIGMFFLLRKTFLKELDGFSFWFLVLFTISGTPYRNQLGVGQHTLFAFFFFLLAVYGLRFSGKKGFVLTTLGLFVCYFKYTLTAVLLLYFIYKKKYKEVLVSVLMHVFLTFVSAIWLSDSFINMIIKPLKVSSALVAEGGIDIGVLLKGSPFAYVLTLVIMAALFIFCIKLGPSRDGLVISILILWSLIITYHRSYDFFVLMAVAALFINEDVKKIVKYHYLILIFYINYILRLFSENTLSKLGAGILYYSFTLVVTYLGIRALTKGEKGENPGNGMDG
ncbi:MAG: DUF2029 domain-containing protein [Lachnospiraceae bacterium]|nr:DUF2029 domain-containing protein [Lachnospiraceae bacterium]